MTGLTLCGYEEKWDIVPEDEVSGAGERSLSGP